MAIISYTGAGATTVWPIWCATTARSVTDSNCLPAWCEITGSSATNATTTVWIRWNGTDISLSGANVTVATREERERIEAQRQHAEAETRAFMEEQRKHDEKLRQEREAAQKRAEELLLANLNREQTEQYRKEKRFVVKGGDGASFELSPSWSGNVRELDEKGKAVRRFCIQPRETVPLADLMLAQKLMLETDPEAFRRIANVHPV